MKQYGSVTHNGKSYKTVVIGSQTWMAEDLSGGAWAFIMDLPMGSSDNCNYKSCASLISAKHRGRCPEGWHVPSRDDWDKLVSSVGGAKAAIKHLRAIDGNNCTDSCPCEDTYGFSARGNSWFTTAEALGIIVDLGQNGHEREEWIAYYAFSMWYVDCETSYGSNYNRNFSKEYASSSLRCLQD